MSGLVDTNMILRYLLQSPPDQAVLAAEILDGEDDLYVTDVVLTEVAHVLRAVYLVPREEIIDHLVALLGKENLSPLGLARDTVIQGLMFCRPSGRVSVPDAMTWAAARSSGIGAVYTFDQRFPSEGIDVIVPH